mmetsp:Transcript_3362/g.7615  ORF Transcript_3362/g.7615 Transcript_3362/m.7615 type:complete len:292 (-) Transcript_3362:104-979(-)
MSSCTSMRLGQVQISPWFRANITAPSTALSKKASSCWATLGMKIMGDLPPSSMVTGMMVLAAACITLWPVTVDPVNAILAIRSDVDSAAPASAPKPVTMLSTPGGSRSPTSSISTMMEVGVCSAGFKTMQLPAARAGATFQAAMRRGKFQGMICPTTPRGSLMTMLTVSSSCSAMLPSSARMAAAKYLKWSTTKGRSAAIVSLTALPLSMVSTIARCCRLASILSAIFSRMFERVVADVLPQAGAAACAASSAASTSACPERAALVKATPSMGDLLSKYSPPMGGTNLPPM